MIHNRGIGDSFRAAFSGFRKTMIFERVFKVMVFVALLVVIAMFYFPTSRLEKVVLLASIFAVLALELINSTVERIMNLVEPRFSSEVRVIKDLMAAIVLLASVGALIIGLMIFLPYILR